MADEWVIEAQGVEKAYGRQWALRGVDLKVPRGTAFGLIGPNGAGKTTLLKSLLGIVHPTRGTVKLFGHSPQDPMSRRRVGYVPERLDLPASFSARQVLTSVARLKSYPLESKESDGLLERVGLGGVGPKRVQEYSKGMKQRLGLACALLGAPDLLVLDEPTDGVDPIGRREIREVLLREIERGVTLFLNSHLLSESEKLCERIAVLKAGKVVQEGMLTELSSVKNGWTVRLQCQDGSVETVRLAVDSPLELNSRLDEFRAKGHLLLGLSPDHRDLESIFSEAMKS